MTGKSKDSLLLEIIAADRAWYTVSDEESVRGALIPAAAPAPGLADWLSEASGCYVAATRGLKAI